MAALPKTVLHERFDPIQGVPVDEAVAQDPLAIKAIIQRYNQRLYRLIRAILRNDAIAEDVLQETYLRAFSSLDSFRGDASFSTWLSRIAINEALGRLRREKRREKLRQNIAAAHRAEIISFPLAQSSGDPERNMAQSQLLHMVEKACDELPDVYRLVFVARVIEGLSVIETAEVLDLQPATVKTRLHRARAILRRELEAQIGPIMLDAFPFAGRRCQRVTGLVLEKMGFREPHQG